MPALFPNWTGWHVINTILAAVGVSATALSHSTALTTQLQGLAGTVAQVDTSLLAIVVVLSGTAAATPALKKMLAKGGAK
jgi:hypothetical protein